MKTTEALSTDNSFELSKETTATEAKIYTDEQLVVPSLLPYLSEAYNAQPILKRNETLPENDKDKIKQKRIELAFGSSIFLDTEIFLNRWSILARNEDQTLTCPKSEVLNEIFTQLASFGNSINADFPVDPIDGEILIPKLKKPQSLITALDAERKNKRSLEYIYQYLLNLVN